MINPQNTPPLATQSAPSAHNYLSNVFIHKKYKDVIVWKHLPNPTKDQIHEMTQKLFSLIETIAGSFYYIVDLTESKKRADSDTRKVYADNFKKQIKLGLQHACIVSNSWIYRLSAKFVLRNNSYYSICDGYDKAVEVINMVRQQQNSL